VTEALIVLLLFFFFLFFNTGALVQKYTNFSHTNFIASLVVSGLLFIKLERVVGLSILAPTSLLMVFLLWAFLVSLSINRVILYSLGLFFLVLSPVLFLLGFVSIAQICGNTSLAFISVAIIKDVFYEKIFNS